MSTKTLKEIELDKNGLPCITKVLSEEQFALTTFNMAPTTPFLTHGTLDETYKPKIGVRQLVLEKNHATPFHKNPDKDKTFLVLSGYVTVYVFAGGNIIKHERSFSSDALLIPAGTPHAVLGTGEGGNQVIVSFTPDMCDVVWQDGAAALHGKKGPEIYGQLA